MHILNLILIILLSISIYFLWKEVKHLWTIISTVIENQYHDITELGQFKKLYELEKENIRADINEIYTSPPFNLINQTIPTNAILSHIIADLKALEEYLGIKKEYYTKINPIFVDDEQIKDKALQNAPKISRVRYIKADKVNKKPKRVNKHWI